MKALRLPQTDKERLQILNTIYVKGLSTPKNELAFSADMLVYLKPFISKLQANVDRETMPQTTLGSVRQVVDELINDILVDIEAACLRMGGKRGARLASDYGLNFAFSPFDTEYYYSNKAA